MSIDKHTEATGKLIGDDAPPKTGITVRQLSADQKPFADGEPNYWLNNSVPITEFMRKLKFFLCLSIFVIRPLILPPLYCRYIICFISGGRKFLCPLSDELRTRTSSYETASSKRRSKGFYIAGDTPCKHPLSLQQDYCISLWARYGWS
jgi:hypothetical protein